MTITGAIVLYAVFWTMGMLIALPLGLETHGDNGTADANSPASSPINANLRAKARRVTVISAVLWALTCGIIVSGLIGIEDLDFWRRM